MHNNISVNKKQDGQDDIFLVDIGKSGKERQWREKKMIVDILSEIYYRLSEKYIENQIYYSRKAERLEWCSNYLEFQRMNDDSRRLTNGNFCRVRLCPLCAWRRSLKIYANMRRIMSNMDGKYSYIFLTLTVRNCVPNKLNETICDIMQSWNRFIKYKEIDKIAKGWYRGLEVTHDVKHDLYHPHFHVVIAVNRSYFTDRSYIAQARWCELWKRAMKIDYTPICDVRRVKGDTAKAVAECAKYTVKDKDYIDPEDLEMSEQAVRVLDEALHKKRLVAFGGIMKKLHKQLNLDDEIDGDLVKVDDEKVEDSEAVVRETYAWNVGYRNYVKINL